jgi:hypothetical protein
VLVCPFCMGKLRAGYRSAILWPVPCFLLLLEALRSLESLQGGNGFGGSVGLGQVSFALPGKKIFPDLYIFFLESLIFSLGGR